MKDINCFNIRPNYYVADTDGNIYLKSNMHKKKTFKNTCGYNLISLVCKDNVSRYFLVHRVILQTYNPVPDPEKYEVNHIYGKDKGDYLENLEWTTGSENIKHAYRTGLMVASKGENSPVTQFTNNFVHTLCSIMEDKYSYKDILLELQRRGYYIVLLSNDELKLKRLISVIRQKLAWVDISSKYNIIRKPKRQYGAFSSLEQIQDVCELIRDGYSNKDICIKIFKKISGKYMCLIRSIRNNRTYRYISNKYW